MQPDPLTPQFAPAINNTERLANAAHRLMQAERSGDPEAIKRAEAYLAFYEKQVLAEGAREREALAFEAEHAEYASTQKAA